jgi:hypothetical protein
LADALPVGRFKLLTELVAAYVVPAAIVWAILGLILNILPLGATALILIAVYAAFYGLLEASGSGWPAPPGRKWQVPSAWIRSVPARRRTLIWGSVLGPGFATRNPYAGFGLLPLVVAAVGNIRVGVALAASIGIAHGAGRAFALTRAVRSDTADDLLSVRKLTYWRIFDGNALLMIGGVAVIAELYRFG